MKKWHFLAALFLLVVLFHWCSGQENKSEVIVRRYMPAIRKSTFNELLARRLRNLWSWIVARSSGDTFVGRCLGVARKLKMIMPLMVFKMGVILTILVFLTIFSLKGLGLLIALLFMNGSGLFAKFIAAKESHQASKPWTRPQNIHFHVHPSKFSSHYEHSGSGQDHYSHSPWDRYMLADSTDYKLASRLGLSELYSRLGLNYANLDDTTYTS